jgi:cardiolipin synthase
MPVRTRRVRRAVSHDRSRAAFPNKKPHEYEGPMAPVRVARRALGIALALTLGLVLVTVAFDEEEIPDTLSFPDSLPGVRASAPGFERTLALYTHTQFEQGNDIRILLNGDSTFRTLWSDLRSARHTIFVQQYFAEPGALMDTLAAILAERARAGVRVRVLFDGIGAAPVPEDWRDSLRAAGVQVATFRPLQWRTIFGAAHRSHARMVTVDGRIGYAGGFGFADKWLGSGHAPGEWRETNVRVQGPVAEQLQITFGIAWFEAVGEFLAGDELAVEPRGELARGGIRAGVLYSAPGAGKMAAERFLALAVMSAEKRLFIANSYFVPTAGLRRLLIRAAQRGVDVRILAPSSETDMPVARSAARARFEELLAGGVRIWEYRPAMMHAKTLVVDTRWATVGSMNFDPQSIAFNDEANVVVMDAGFAAQMERLFDADIRLSREITLQSLRERPLQERVLEWFARKVEHKL